MKKGFTLVELLGILLILAVIALIAFPIVQNTIKNSQEKALERNIETIEEAAYRYSVENDIGYPSESDKKYLMLSDIQSKGFLDKQIINPVTDEVMNGCVWYYYDENYNQYVFEYDGVCEIPPTLIELLLEQYNEDNTTGLIKDSSNPNLYYYKGTNEEVSNNYLWYGGHHWRVLEFDTSANTLLLISQQPLTIIQSASSVWTTEESYESSYINNWLNDYFYNSLDSSVQNNIVNNTFNVGIYTDVDEITTTQKVGLLDEEQYTRAGATDSYLDIKDIFGLGNRSSSSYVRYVHSNGSIGYHGPAFAISVRAVIKISDVTITGGNGTLTSNYEAGNKATNTSDIQVGEYINVPYSGDDNACGADNKCTFKVVSKDGDSIKVVLNGLLPTTSQYGSNATITASHTIYTPLNTFANNISSDYRYTGNKTFYIGDYSNGANYTDVQYETLSTSVGLPTIGEMFSGNDIDLSTSSAKTFVNVATIENPTVSSYYWTMNRSSSSFVRNVNNDGDLNRDIPSNSYGVRAVIYLKSGTSALTFTGGEGTAESPYELQ